MKRRGSFGLVTWAAYIHYEVYMACAGKGVTARRSIRLAEKRWKQLRPKLKEESKAELDGNERSLKWRMQYLRRLWNRSVKGLVRNRRRIESDRRHYDKLKFKLKG